MTEETPWRRADVLRSLYIEEDLTTREIGEKLGCSRKTVENWLKKHDIEQSPEDANTLDNLVALCRSCHNTIEPPNVKQND